jgi:hypothetical protein
MEGMRGSLGKRRRQEDKRGPGEESKDGKQGHCQVKLESYTHWWNEGVTGGKRLTIKWEAFEAKERRQDGFEGPQASLHKSFLVPFQHLFPTDLVLCLSIWIPYIVIPGSVAHHSPCGTEK